MQFANPRSPFSRPPARINTLFTNPGCGDGQPYARFYMQRFPALFNLQESAPTTKYEHPRVTMFKFIENELDLPANLEAPMTTTANTDPDVDPELEAFRDLVRDRLYEIFLYKRAILGLPPAVNSLKRMVVNVERRLFAEADTKEDYMNLKTLRSRLYHAYYPPIPNLSYESLCEGVTIDSDGHLIDREGVRIDSDSDSSDSDTDEEEDVERDSVGNKQIDNVLEDQRVNMLKFMENGLDLPDQTNRFNMQFPNPRSPFRRPPAQINTLFKNHRGHPKAPLFFHLLNQRSRARFPESAPTTKYEHPRVRVFNFIQKLDLSAANLEASMTTTANTDPNVDPELEAFRNLVRNHLYQIFLHIRKGRRAPQRAADRMSRNSLNIYILNLERELFAEADTKEDYMNLKTLRSRLYHAYYAPIPNLSYESLCEGVTIDRDGNLIDRDGHLIDREGVRKDSDSKDDTNEEEVERGSVGNKKIDENKCNEMELPDVVMDNVLEDPRVRILKFIENELDLPANLEALMSTKANTDPCGASDVDPELEAFRDLVRDRLNEIFQYKMKIEGRKLETDVVDLERRILAEANTKEDYPPMRKRHASGCEDTPPHLCKKACVETSL